VPAPGTGATAECIAGAIWRPRPRVRKCPAAEDMADRRGVHPRERGPAAVRRRQRPCRRCRATIVAPLRTSANGRNERSLSCPVAGTAARRGRPPLRPHAPPTMAVTTPVPWQSGQDRRSRRACRCRRSGGRRSRPFRECRQAPRRPAPLQVRSRSGEKRRRDRRADRGWAWTLAESENPTGQPACRTVAGRLTKRFRPALDNRLRNATLPRVVGAEFACRNILRRQRLRGSAPAWESPRRRGR
jgi:hypothetical protein